MILKRKRQPRKCQGGTGAGAKIQEEPAAEKKEEVKAEKEPAAAKPPVRKGGDYRHRERGIRQIEEKHPDQELIKGRADKLQGLKVLDRIQLPEKKKDAPVASSDTQKENKGKRPQETYCV